MVKRGFTQNEIRTLDGLIRYPLFNDRELSQKTGINLSTVTAIRRRLYRLGYIHPVTIPNFHLLGAELLTIGYGPLAGKKGGPPVKVLNKFVAGEPSIFNAAFSKENGTIMCYHRDYTRARQTMDALESTLAANDLCGNTRWNFAIFPFELSRYVNFFNHATLFRRKFGIEGEPFDVELDYTGRETKQLTEKEKDVLIGLVSNPSLTDKATGKRVGASRQAVSKIRKRLLDQGLLMQRNTLDLRKLDFEILALAHTRFDPNARLKARRDGVDYILNRIPQFLSVSGDTENFLAAAFSTYPEFNEARTEVLRFYNNSGFIDGEPNVQLMALKDTVYVRYHEYVPALKELLAKGS